MSWELAAGAGDRNPTAVVQLAGELDLDARDELCQVIQQAVGDRRSRVVTVDLGGVTFLDSEALGVLIDGWNTAQRASKSFRVVNARGIVRRVLDVAGVFIR